MIDLYFVKLGGSAFTYKNDTEKNERFLQFLTEYTQNKVMNKSSFTSLESQDESMVQEKEFQSHVEAMIRTDVVLSFGRTLARWLDKSRGEDARKFFVIILGGGSPAHGAVKVARALGLSNKTYGVFIRTVVGYMSAIVTSLLSRTLPINYIPTSAWFYWEKERNGQVVDVRPVPPPSTFQDHMRLGLYPLVGGDVILGKHGWAILSGDPIPYFFYAYWLQQSPLHRESTSVKETIMLSDIGVPTKVAGFYDSDPSNSSAQLITKILVKHDRCLMELESGTRMEVSLPMLNDNMAKSSSESNQIVDVTGGMLQKIWWQVKLAQEGVPTRILDYRLLEDYLMGKDVLHTRVIADQQE